jgi:hypothetical protein
LLLVDVVCVQILVPAVEANLGLQEKGAVEPVTLFLETEDCLFEVRRLLLLLLDGQLGVEAVRPHALQDGLFVDPQTGVQVKVLFLKVAHLALQVLDLKESLLLL